MIYERKTKDSLHPTDEKDVRLMVKRGKDINKLVTILDLLSSQNPHPAKYKDHQLKGKEKDFRECHIELDWVLIYKIYRDELILSATRTGVHSDLLE